MSSKSSTVSVNAREYEGHDDCLSAAASDYAEEHGLEGYDLDPRWEDDERDVILLTVPRWSATVAATPAHIATIEAQAYDDVAREMARTGLTLTYAQADSIGEVGVDWLRRRLGLRVEETDAGVECVARR